MAGRPGPAPFLRAETFYRYQIMLRTKFMNRLNHQLSDFLEQLRLPDDLPLAVDIDPVDLI